jgi:hypothetical protein
MTTRALLRRWAAGLLAAVALSACPQPPPAPPTTGTCDAPGAGAVSTLEVGYAVELTPDFKALHDGDALRTIWGDQGSEMIPLRLRVAGAAPPACLDQKTTVADEQGAPTSSLSVAVPTFAEDDGSRTTHSLYLVLSHSPMVATVTASAGGQQASVTLYRQPPDLGAPDDASATDGAHD